MGIRFCYTRKPPWMQKNCRTPDWECECYTCTPLESIILFGITIPKCRMPTVHMTTCPRVKLPKMPKCQNNQMLFMVRLDMRILNWNSWVIWGNLAIGPLVTRTFGPALLASSSPRHKRTHTLPNTAMLNERWTKLLMDDGWWTMNEGWWTMDDQEWWKM